MYNSPKELHIGIDLVLQHITSNRKQSILPELKDMVLNSSCLAYIDSIIDDRRNKRNEGFEANQLNYDELAPLKKTCSIPLYYVDSTKSIGILPSDYKNHSRSNVSYYYNRNGIIPNLQSVNKYVATIKVTDFTSADGLLFSTFKLWIERDTIETLYTIDTDIIKVVDKDGLFMLVNDVLDKVSRNNFEIYWEYYGDTYAPTSFIIVSDTEIVNGGLKDGENNATIDTINYQLSTLNNTKTSPTDLIKSSEIDEVLGNMMYTLNRHRKPLIDIQQNKIVVFKNNNFDVNSLSLTYIKRPRLININTGAMCEIKVGEKIVDLSAQKLKAYIEGSYQAILNENKTN